MKMRMKRGENEMTVKTRCKLLNRNTRRGTQKKRRNQERTPTPTHLPQTLERQGKRKSGGRRKQTKTRGGEDGRAWTNLAQRKQSLPKHARTKTYLEQGGTHEIGDQWGPSWWQTEKTTKGFSSVLGSSCVTPITGTWSVNPEGHVTAFKTSRIGCTTDEPDQKFQRDHVVHVAWQNLSLEHRRNRRCLRQSVAYSEKKFKPGTAARCSTHRSTLWDPK